MKLELIYLAESKILLASLNGESLVDQVGISRDTLRYGIMSFLDCGFDVTITTLDL